MWYECIPSMAIITVAMSMGNVVAWAVNKLYQGNVSWTIFYPISTWHGSTSMNESKCGYIMWCCWFDGLWIQFHKDLSENNSCISFVAGLQSHHGRSIWAYNVCQRSMHNWGSIQSQRKDMFLFSIFVNGCLVKANCNIWSKSSGNWSDRSRSD